MTFIRPFFIFPDSGKRAAAAGGSATCHRGQVTGMAAAGLRVAWAMCK